MTAILSILGRLAPYLIAAAVGAAGAHYLDANHYGAELSAAQRDLAKETAAHAEDLKAVNDTAQRALQAAVAWKEKYERDVAALDAKYTKERNDAQVQMGALRAAVADGSLRLRFAVSSCTAASAGSGSGVSATGAAAGLDHGSAGTAELDGRATNQLFSITGRGDGEIMKLRAAQEYITKVCVVQPK
ncbi:lysis system i-spanin subunit Rz [Paraburkholderia terrae]|uniref:lysis system i-spanin subunit Rz n=1 Tax=Paraburkholderia terrae TaxID=311230 RepID=UPI001EE263FA|nr:lysis system i-spanin subunit Rz [Paraburkholderia terrae]GJH00198.1 lysis protein [Paraburkholderia terrae]